MKIVNTSQMREMDRCAIEDYGIPGLLLMENAGRGIADILATADKGSSIAVFCGKGNNGGDGMVAARHLSNRGHKVKILLFSEPSALKGDARTQLLIVKKMGLSLELIRSQEDLPKVAFAVKEADILVDALLGTGLKDNVRKLLKAGIEAMNDSGKSILSVDVPSGLNSDTGEAMGTAVRAHMTGTLALPKEGLFLKDGPDYAGMVHVIDIGMPAKILD